MQSKSRKGERAMKDKGKVRAVIVPDKLWDDLRMQSLREKRSASDIIRQLVSEYLEKGGKRR
jgi:hypothetical protein